MEAGHTSSWQPATNLTRPDFPRVDSGKEHVMGILTDTFLIACKSPIVIGKRLMKFAKGGRGGALEAARAVREKAELGASSAAALASGTSMASIVKRYRRKVEANARRL